MSKGAPGFAADFCLRERDQHTAKLVQTTRRTAPGLRRVLPRLGRDRDQIVALVMDGRTSAFPIGTAWLGTTQVGAVSGRLTACIFDFEVLTR